MEHDNSLKTKKDRVYKKGRVAISIVSYNATKRIERSFGSALKQTYGDIEIFVVDNDSKDDTLDKIRQMQKANGARVPLRIIANKDNVGFGAGHNISFRNTEAEYVLCLNDDCNLDVDYVRYCVEALEADKNAAGVQGKLANPVTGTIDTAGMVMYRNRRAVNRGQGEKDTGQYDTAQDVWGVDGAAPMYRVEALEDVKIGDEYFDGDFFMYKEDVDLVWRLRLAGWKFLYAPKARADHDRSAGEGASRNPIAMMRARKGISVLAKSRSLTNQRLMQIKNETPPSFLLALPRLVVKEIVSWTYALIFERYALRSAFNMVRLTPKMLKKRHIVMKKRRVSHKEIQRWFV